MIATAALHALGIAVGFLIGRLSASYGTAVYRVAGGAASIAGLAILAGIF
jgi:urease accessory protein